METKELSNKKSQKRIRLGQANLNKPLRGNGLRNTPSRLAPRGSRETLVNHCKQIRYDCQMVIMALSDPVTFLPSSAVGNRVKIENIKSKISLILASISDFIHLHLGLIADL
jgi:hypothetical protein